jgi:hypothetical protein
MATSRSPQFLQRRLARRAGASDLVRLAGDYQKQIQGLTAEYETRFSDYQKTVAEQMAPFDAATRQYQDVQMPAYEAAMEQYKQEYEGYQRQLDEIAKNPVTKKKVEVLVRRPKSQGTNYRTETRYEYVKKPIPVFKSTAPELPEMPEAPKIAEFDSSEFEQRRAQVQQGFQRETAERRSARLNAVQRRGRGMLGGVK